MLTTKVMMMLMLTLLSFTLFASHQQVSLNGDWQFTTEQFASDNSLIQAHYAAWDKMPVPGNWDTTKKYSEYSGKAYYQKSFAVPSSWQGKNLRIKFDAVYQTAKVWLNGQYLGKHVGGYTPFEFAITDLVNFNKANSLVVMADNSYQRGAWWAWGGISRDVTLLADNQVRIVHQHISAEPNFATKTIAYSIDYKLQSYSNQAISSNIETIIFDGQKQKKQLNTQVTLAPNQITKTNVKFVEPLENYHLWHINQPYLYTLNSAIRNDNYVYDSQLDNFGVRKFEVRGEQFFFNNEPIRLNGINRVHDHPSYGNTEPDFLVMGDMRDIKALGGHFSRLMHAPLSKNLLEICDRLGYLIIGEIPVWGDDDPQSFPDNPLTKQWLKEMIERDFNHPSIVGWSVGNELRDPVPPWGKKTLTPDQFGYINSMLDYVAELDPTRLKTYVSLTAFSQYANLSNEPFAKLDFISINSYSNAVKKVEATHKNFPGKPIFLSEIGLKQFGGTKDARLQDELVADLRTLKDYPYLMGFSLWAYNDYRSNYKGTPESGFREWGVVDHYRNKKAAYYQLKEVLQYWQE
ncbi:glycoside hydrolase family 2 [Saccharobesus litoralis]|uniref:Glycoside hydrolase family 2 n=2 Tax=Saccharobesus litoralis TaxID=2172099 RepID=A0A2S0VM55_9ALTE|nr:glycoside hydrolase family 2 [Saccharobesus litoralis]